MSIPNKNWNPSAFVDEMGWTPKQVKSLYKLQKCLDDIVGLTKDQMDLLIMELGYRNRETEDQFNYENQTNTLD